MGSPSRWGWDAFGSLLIQADHRLLIHAATDDRQRPNTPPGPLLACRLARAHRLGDPRLPRVRLRTVRRFGQFATAIGPSSARIRRAVVGSPRRALRVRSTSDGESAALNFSP